MKLISHDPGDLGNAKNYWRDGQGQGNPASYYCAQLGGAEIGATALPAEAGVSSAKKNNIDMA